MYYFSTPPAHSCSSIRHPCACTYPRTPASSQRTSLTSLKPRSVIFTPHYCSHARDDPGPAWLVEHSDSSHIHRTHHTQGPPARRVAARAACLRTAPKPAQKERPRAATPVEYSLPGARVQRRARHLCGAAHKAARRPDHPTTGDHPAPLLHDHRWRTACIPSRGELSCSTSSGRWRKRRGG